MHSFIPTYLGGTSFIFCTFLSGTIFVVGGGVHVYPVHPPAYAPDLPPYFFSTGPFFISKKNLNRFACKINDSLTHVQYFLTK